MNADLVERSRTLSFGKINYGNKGGRRLNLVTVDISLRNEDTGRPEFSACGNVWNATQTDLLMCGQCLDDIGPVPENSDLFKEIVGYWSRYHLNSMYPGTEAQIAALEEAGIYNTCPYDKACEYLKSKGLYEVELTDEEKKWNPKYADQPYMYGHGWLYRPIPEQDLARIRDIIDGKVGVTATV